MQASKKSFIIWLAIAISIVSTLYFFFSNKQESKPEELAVKYERTTEKRTETNDINNLDKASEKKFKTSKSTYQNSYYNTKNYHTFVNNQLVKAKNGDADANYYIYKALNECLPWLSHPKFQTAELFESYIHSNAVHSYNANVKESIKTTYTMCKDFIGENIQELYGGHKNWLNNALKLNQPVAKASALVSEMAYFINPQLEDFRIEPLSNDNVELTEELLMNKLTKSLLSKRADVFFEISQAPIQFENKPDATYVALLFLACDYGMLCKSEEPITWLKHYCQNDSCYYFNDAKKMLESQFPQDTIEKAKTLSTKLKQAIENNDFKSLKPSLLQPHHSFM